MRPLSTFNNTLGSMAGPGEAHDTTTDEVGSAPQVRWTCSGVPLVLVGVGTGPMLVKRVNAPLLRTSDWGQRGGQAAGAGGLQKLPA